MSNLYELTEHLAGILQSIDFADGEIPDELQQHLDRAEGDLAAKLDACCRFMRSREARAVGIQAEIVRLKAAADADQRKAEWIKQYMKNCMMRLDVPSIETPLFKLRVQKSPVSVRLTGDDIPEQYQRQAKVEFDKSKAIADHKAGVPLPEGVEIVQGTHLRIS